MHNPTCSTRPLCKQFLRRILWHWDVFRTWRYLMVVTFHSLSASLTSWYYQKSFRALMYWVITVDCRIWKQSCWCHYKAMRSIFSRKAWMKLERSLWERMMGEWNRPRLGVRGFLLVDHRGIAPLQVCTMCLVWSGTVSFGPIKKSIWEMSKELGRTPSTFSFSNIFWWLIIGSA